MCSYVKESMNDTQSKRKKKRSASKSQSLHSSMSFFKVFSLVGMRRGWSHLIHHLYTVKPAVVVGGFTPSLTGVADSNLTYNLQSHLLLSTSSLLQSLATKLWIAVSSPSSRRVRFIWGKPRRLRIEKKEKRSTDMVWWGPLTRDKHTFWRQDSMISLPWCCSLSLSLSDPQTSYHLVWKERSSFRLLIMWDFEPSNFVTSLSNNYFKIKNLSNEILISKFCIYIYI